MSEPFRRFRQDTRGIVVEWYDITTLQLVATEGPYRDRALAEAAVGPETPDLAWEMARCAASSAAENFDLPSHSG